MMCEYPGVFMLVIYLILINLVAVVMTVSDKKKAEKNKWRIREKDLLTVAAMGGSVAMYLTMKKIRHKTQHKKFMLGIPAIFAAQVLLVILLIVIF